MARSHMNMPIICVRSFCGVNEVPDFTNCKRVPGRAYNGANGKKIAIEYQGEQYMLKFPPSGQGKRTELSYTNSCISEHIASTIFNMVGIKRRNAGPCKYLSCFTFHDKSRTGACVF